MKTRSPREPQRNRRIFNGVRTFLPANKNHSRTFMSFDDKMKQAIPHTIIRKSFSLESPRVPFRKALR